MRPAAVAARAAVLLACAAILLAGCGAEKRGPSAGPDPNDKRATALDCLRNEKRLDARLAGPSGIQIGDPAMGPKIRFYLTQGAAEAAQFAGEGEGSEHIGSALLFTRGASEETLEEVEFCLDDL